MSYDLSHRPYGVWTALVTPFNSSYDIDYKAFDHLLERQVAAHVHGVVLCGTTGEAPTLSVTEKLSLIKRAKRVINGKCGIMVGCGSSDTSQTVELSKLCVASGADSLMVVTPPYNKPSLTGLIAHFGRVCDTNPDTPVVVYHVPGRTGQKLDHSDLARLLHSHDGLVAVKEASGNPIEFSRYIAKYEELMASDSHQPVAWLNGDDHAFLAGLATGATGVVSVLSNIFPHEVVDLYQSFTKDTHIQRATRLHKTLLPFTDDLFVEVNPVPVKTVLHHLNLVSSELRLPLTPASDDLKKHLINSYEHTKASLGALAK
ncbi:MAG: 4-hydroxy-tetrahydrodipicolinate synthase [Proteobacteria bacterium]|nr:4-hydroxy-tetrahydrodipicolinate synthase [Pseudomonadota bacterium]